MSDELPDLIAEAADVLRRTAQTGEKTRELLRRINASDRELDELSADIARRVEVADKLDAAAARMRRGST